MGYSGERKFNMVDDHDKSLIAWRAERKSLEDDLASKERIEDRLWDLYRNNDNFRGLIEKQIDFNLGATVRLQSMPDHEGLGVDREQARAWAKECERRFHNYVDSPENWISADRTMDFTQMMRSAERQRLLTGEILGSREWRRSPLGFSTCVQLISSSRLKNPSNKATVSTISSSKNRVSFGIEMDRFNTPLAYHIESAQITQVTSFGRKNTKRYSKYNRFGWLQLWHIYEPMFPEYPRGISRSAAVLIKLKDIERYTRADLDKAIIATNYVFTITSDEDPETVADALSGANDPKYQQNSMALDTEISSVPRDVLDKRDEILAEITTRYVETTGGQVVHLFNGEKMETVNPPQNLTSSGDFIKTHLKSAANGMGISYELGTGDFAGINFSAGQLSLGIHEHSANIQRTLYVHKFGKLIFRAWLDEAMDKGALPLLGDMEYFPNRELYSKCSFSGARSVQADPLKTSRSQQIDLDTGVTSRTDIANVRGQDFETITAKRATEARIILTEIESVAKETGVDLSDEMRLKVLIDVIATQKVTPPALAEIDVEGTEETIGES